MLSILALLSLIAAAAAANGATFHVFDAATAWEVLPDPSNPSLMGSGRTNVTSTTNTTMLGWMQNIPTALRSQAQALPSFSVVWSAMLQTTVSLSFRCSILEQQSWIVTTLVWIDDHIVCDESGTYLPFQIPPPAHHGLELRMVVLAKRKDRRSKLGPASAQPDGPSTPTSAWDDEGLDFGLAWQPTSPNNGSSSSWRTELHPTVPPDVQHRLQLQQQSRRGWGTWLHRSFLAHVLQPSAVALRLAIGTESSSHVRCDGKLRPGLHALDHSYTRVSMQATVESNSTNSTAERWVHVTSAHVAHHELVVLIELDPATPHVTEDMDDPILSIYLGLHYAWNGTGAVEIITSNSGQHELLGLRATPDGRQQREVDIHMTTSLYHAEHDFATIFEEDDDGVVVRLDLTSDQSAIGIATGRDRSLAEIQRLVGQAHAATLKSIQRDTEGFSADQVEGYRAMQSVLGWNVIYNQLEHGPVVPVSRGWAFHDGYVLFEWDNFLASYMLSGMHGQPGAKDLAYSNLIQTIKSRTTDGFVPNFAAGPDKSRDRTEPPLGAQVLERMFHEHGDEWIVRLLFDDLLAWNTWFWNHRRLDPLGLIALGSDPYEYQPEHHVNDLQAAKYESGQDNSPMYDDTEEELFCTKRHKMLLYDVGMTALFVAEAQALSRLGRRLHRDAVVQELDARAAEMSQLLLDHLWDEDRWIFANRYQQGEAKVSDVHSPTSFFPLLLGGTVVSDDAVDRIVTHHLLNATRFCLENATDTSSGCIYGVPASPFDHPSFVDQNYWRGRVWGPLNIILYWALERYDHIPSARRARQLLVEHSLTLLLIPWRSYGHVHENYNPLTGQGCDSGNSDPFYHWGALNAYMSVVEHRRRGIQQKGFELPNNSVTTQTGAQ